MGFHSITYKSNKNFGKFWVQGEKRRRAQMSPESVATINRKQGDTHRKLPIQGILRF